MVTDSITNASVLAAPNNAAAARDLGKKKRARSAKLKQSKLDVRREQWLSQGSMKNKDLKEEQDGVVQERKDPNSHSSIGNLEGRHRGGANNGSIHHHHHHHHDSDLDSNSHNSLTSSVLGSNYSETIFTGSSSGSSSSSGGCCSGNITEDDEDGCLDDWEAVADALAAEENPKHTNSESPPEHHQIDQSNSPREMNTGSIGVQNWKPHARNNSKASSNGLAWRPDDAFRPQCLPNLAKQLSLPDSNRKQYGRSGVPWGYNVAPSLPDSCPMCCEDLDFTDTSFLPCLCGYRMCLFCHKTIMEGDDPRCPNCRNPYKREPFEAKASLEGGRLTFQLARSCSMITRS